MSIILQGKLEILNAKNVVVEIDGTNASPRCGRHSQIKITAFGVQPKRGEVLPQNIICHRIPARQPNRNFRKARGLAQVAKSELSLGGRWMIQPEQSTSAIVVHHPEAR
jgi:hypothetical protein